MSDQRASPAPHARRAAALIAAALWVAALGYSLFMAQPSITGRERRVLFFPALSGGGGALRLIGEVRYVPYRAAAGADLRTLLEETILGPADHRAHRLLPRALEVISAHVRGGTAYVNLSRPMPSPTFGKRSPSSCASRLPPRRPTTIPSCGTSTSGCALPWPPTTPATG